MSFLTWRMNCFLIKLPRKYPNCQGGHRADGPG
jgi:hypothetical protein